MNSTHEVRCYDPQTKRWYVNFYDGRGWLPEAKGYVVTHDYDRTETLKRKYEKLKRELEPLCAWVNQRELDEWREWQRRRDEYSARLLRAQGRLW